MKPSAFITQIKQKVCSHEFNLKDLHLTGIQEPPPPIGQSYDEWSKYFSARYEHDFITKRVVWPCAKCKKVFYAAYGLAISPKYGPTIKETL